MNNWSLLLFAVVAVLLPIGSFTERNLIDGHQECCDHPSNSITQDTRAYGTYRRTTPEERRLNNREEIREEKRYVARNDPIRRSRERLILRTVERQISIDTVARNHAESRIVRDKERHHSRQTREDPIHRIDERFVREPSSQYERDALDLRRIRMSRDDITTIRHRERQHIRDVRNERNSEVRNRDSINRDDVIRDADRVSRVSALRTVTMSQLNDNKVHNTLEHRVQVDKENRRFGSLNSKVNSINKREDIRSRMNIRDQRVNFQSISERVDDRSQEDENRQSKDRISAFSRHSIGRETIAERRRDSRNTLRRLDLNKRNIRETQTLDEIRKGQKRSMQLRESRLSTSTERIPTLARESRLLTSNIRSERNMNIDERRDAQRDMQQVLRDRTMKLNSRRSRTLDAITYDERLVRNNERFVRNNERDNQREHSSTRSLDRVSALRTSSDRRSNEQLYNSRDLAQLPQRNTREERAGRYFRNMDNVDQRKQQNYETRLSKDRSMSMLRGTRDVGRKQETRETATSLTRLEANVRSEQSIRGDLRDNERMDIRHRERGDIRRVSRENTLARMASDTERNPERHLSRVTRFTERASSNDRVSRMTDDIRSARFDTRQENRYERMTFGVRNVVLQRLTRDVLSLERRDSRRSSRINTNALLQNTRVSADNDERRNVNGRESRVSRDSTTTVSRQRIENQRREARESRGTNVDAQNHNDVRMAERFELRRQQDERRSTHNILAARSTERTRDLTSRGIETRFERILKNRDVRHHNEGEIRKIREYPESAMDRDNSRIIRDMRTEATRSSDIVLNKNIKREVSGTRFRNLESKIRELESIDETSTEYALSWQMIFYTLQGAYLCGLLVQMLTEKPVEKSKKFTWWTSSRELLKVD